MERNFLTFSFIGIIIGLIISIIATSMCNSFISLSIFGILLIILSGYYYIQVTDNKLSVTFWLICSVVVGMIVLVISRDSIFGMRIDGMSSDIAEFYYEQIITLLTALFTGFVLGISILWVAYRPVYAKSNKTGEVKLIAGVEYKVLKCQTIFLFLLFVYVVLNIFLILIELSGQIIGN